MPSNWFLDFDDTLVSGSTTWGLEHAVPQLIREHQLPYNPEAFQSAALVAQQQINGGIEIDAVLTELFDKLGWPQNLRQSLIKSVLSAYQPAIFEDALPFLNRLREKGHAIYVISNNARAPEIAASMGLHNYMTALFTPAMFPGTKSKPHRSIWDSILAKYPQIDVAQSVIVGDDPWSDGAFAEACGLKCWIVDRRASFTTLYNQKPYRWVTTLADIEIE